MSKNQTKTKKEDIIKFWISKVDETELNFDWGDADLVCWNCGCERKTQRCHIVPHSLNGDDDPSNYVLLCNICHTNAPNCSNPNIMWDWIKSNKTKFGITNCYFIEKGLEEYERIYGGNIINDMISSGINENNIHKHIEEYNKETRLSTHFSDSHFNPVSTAGYVKGLLEDLKGKETEKETEINTEIFKKYIKDYESKTKKWENFMKKVT
jgi:hypothetical protein